MNDFFQSLKQRKLVQWAVAYVAAVFALLQGIDIIAQRFGWPDWIERTLIIAACVGFFVVIVLAWYHGERGAQRVSGTELVILALLLSLGGGFLWRFAAIAQKASAPPPALATKAVVPLPAGAIRAKSIAVLPFENLSDDKNAAYFADGVQDEILTKLASIADLKVISRTSTERYKSKPQDLTTVSQQLGVANVLEGTVQRAEGKVRVNVQLIDARADSHLWAKTYDREIKDVFAVESEVAQEIADALQAKLSPAEATAVARAPTKDMAAYDLFLKGEHEERIANGNYRPESFEEAARWYREAIARDPSFALAIAQLSICRMRQHWLTNPLTESELAEAGQLAKQAVKLAPDLAEAHVAMGVFYYYGFREYEAALVEFQRAIELQPNNSLGLQYVAYVHRRQGKWKATLDELQRALEQDPRDPIIPGTIAETRLILRDWSEAEKMARRTLSLDPHDTAGLRTLLLSVLNQIGKAPLDLLASFPPNDLAIPPNTGTYDMLMGIRAETFVLGRDFSSATKSLENTAAATGDEGQRLVAETVLGVLGGDVAGAQWNAEKARALLEPKVRDHPQDIRTLRALSWVYLGLHRQADAVNTARQTLEVLSPERDAFLGSNNLASLAEMQAQTGAATEAVQNLTHLLSIPAGDTISIARLKLDPVWDPLRKDPRFQALLAGHGTNAGASK